MWKQFGFRLCLFSENIRSWYQILLLETSWYYVCTWWCLCNNACSRGRRWHEATAGIQIMLLNFVYRGSLEITKMVCNNQCFYVFQEGSLTIQYNTIQSFINFFCYFKYFLYRNYQVQSVITSITMVSALVLLFIIMLEK